MFKPTNSEDEIFQFMEQKLSSPKIHKQANNNQQDQLFYAVDLLNKVAQIFEQHNMIAEAQEIINILGQIK